MDNRLGVPFIDPCVCVISRAAVEALPSDVALRHNVAPISLNGSALTVAVENPLDFELLDRLRYRSGMSINIVTADKERIAAVVRWHYGEPLDA
jgi:type IV pilus assembly protein PilB